MSSSETLTRLEEIIDELDSTHRSTQSTSTSLYEIEQALEEIGSGLNQCHDDLRDELMKALADPFEPKPLGPTYNQAMLMVFKDILHVNVSELLGQIVSTQNRLSSMGAAETREWQILDNLARSIRDLKSYEPIQF